MKGAKEDKMQIIGKLVTDLIEHRLSKIIGKVDDTWKAYADLKFALANHELDRENITEIKDGCQRLQR